VVCRLGGVDEDRGVQSFTQSSDEGAARESGHPEVHDCDLGPLGERELERLGAVDRGADDGIAVLGEEVGDGYGERGMVVGEQAARHAATPIAAASSAASTVCVSSACENGFASVRSA